MTRVAGAVLAAGAGVRMGRPKADVVVGGQRLLDRAVSVLAAGGCAPVFAVVRAGTVVSGAVAVVNPDPARGMRSSLSLAASAASAAPALAVILVDAPGIGVAAVSAVAAAWRPSRIAVASFSGRRGHPIVMAPSLWLDAIAMAGPDEGARGFLAAHADLVDVVSVSGDPSDIDTPEELARWNSPR